MSSPDTLLSWLNILLLFVGPAVGAYFGLAVGLVQIRAELKGFRETLNVQIDRHDRDIEGLQRRTHRHGGLLTRVAVKAGIVDIDLGDH